MLHEQDADVDVVGRGRELNWHGVPPPLERPVIDRIRAPIGGLGVGWSSWLAEHLAPVFYSMPASKRVELVGRTFGPAAAWWLRDRIEGKVPVHLGRTVHAARPKAGSVELTLAGSDGEELLSTDYVISPRPGIAFDLGRLAFLDTSLRDEIRTTANVADALSSLRVICAGAVLRGGRSGKQLGTGDAIRGRCRTRCTAIARHLARRSA